MSEQPKYDEACEYCGAGPDEECGRNCPTHEDYDPTPWCAQCGARRPTDCHCGPLADND